MPHARSALEWQNRFAMRLIKATEYKLSLPQALELAAHQYYLSFDSNPETACYRLLAGHLLEDTHTAMAETDKLLLRASRRG